MEAPRFSLVKEAAANEGFTRGSLSRDRRQGTTLIVPYSSKEQEAGIISYAQERMPDFSSVLYPQRVCSSARGLLPYIIRRLTTPTVASRPDPTKIMLDGSGVMYP